MSNIRIELKLGNNHAQVNKKLDELLRRTSYALATEAPALGRKNEVPAVSLVNDVRMCRFLSWFLERNRLGA